MQISKHKVVTMDYTLTDDKGAVIDSSDGSEPFAYIHGVGQIIPGLEEALEGKATGESLSVSIPPDQAYGNRDEALMQVVPRDKFDVADEVQVGMQFQAQSESGTHVVTVVSVEGDEIVVDANHPLAGRTLKFDVTLKEVRDATEEELSHGHVHGPGGHSHD